MHGRLVPKLFFLCFTLAGYKVSAQWPYQYLRGEHYQWAGFIHFQTEKIKYTPSGHLLKLNNHYGSALPFDHFAITSDNQIWIRLDQGIQAGTSPAFTQKLYTGAKYNWGVDAEMNEVGEIYVLGHSSGDNWNLSTPSTRGGTFQILLFKTDKTGNYLWHKTYGGTLDEKAVAIKPSGDGNYYILGNAQSSNTGDVAGNHGGADIWLLKVSGADGSILWKKCFGGSQDDFATDFEVMPGGNLLLAGYTKSIDGDFKLSGAAGYTDGVVFKIDNVGNILWAKTMGGEKDDLVKATELLPDGGFALMGTFSSMDGAIGPNSGLQEIFIQRYNASGTSLWTQTFGGAANTHEIGQDIIYEKCKKQLIAIGIKTPVSGYTIGVPGHAQMGRMELVLDLSGTTLHQKVVDQMPINPAGNSLIEVYTTLAASNYGGFAVGGLIYFVWQHYAPTDPKRATRTWVWHEYGKQLRRDAKDSSVCAGQMVMGEAIYKDTVFVDTLRDDCGTDTLIRHIKITVATGKDSTIVKDTVMCPGAVYKGISYYNPAALYDTSFVSGGCTAVR